MTTWFYADRKATGRRMFLQWISSCLLPIIGAVINTQKGKTTQIL